MEIKVGCSGVPVAQDRYFKEFKLLEVQKTFYQPPSNQVLERWRRQAPADFEFTLKCWQLVTHSENSPTYRRLKERVKVEEAGNFRDSAVVRYGYERTRECARILGANLILFQSPASFRPERASLDNLRKFFKKRKREKFIFVWEPRGKWEIEILKDLYQELGIYIAFDPFKEKGFSQKIVYFRLHGKRGYNYRYSKQELRDLLEMIKKLRFETCYLLFNNVYMWENALEFKELL